MIRSLLPGRDEIVYVVGFSSLILIRVKSFEEAIQVLNHSAYGLSGSIYTQDVNRVMRSIRDMQTGITYINAPTIGAEVHLPFGGVKHTGNGHREAGESEYPRFRVIGGLLFFELLGE